MNDRRAGVILVAIGLVVVGIGVAGLVTDRGAAGSVAVASPGPSATVTAAGPGGATASATPAATVAPSPTASPTSSPTPSPTASPTATPDAEARIRAFYAEFVPAIRTGDIEALMAILHPASIERYGAAGCRASFAQIADSAYAVVVKTVHQPAPWEYARDDRTTTIPDAWAIDVDVTTTAGTAAAVFHVAAVDGEIRWFADCGTPVGASPAP